MATYRPNVAAILQKKNGKIFVAERLDFRGSWQFPQGGVDRGEDLIAAVKRELEEETGIKPKAYEICSCHTGYRYKFPGGHLKKGKYCGQAQTYFLCRYWGKKGDIDLAHHTREFSSYRWIRPEDFLLRWVPRFKRPVFRRVMKDFFDAKLSV